MKRIIVTGGAGFIGSNLIIHLLNKYEDIELMNIDKLTYASDQSYLENVKEMNRYRFKKIDLVDRVAVRDILQKFRPHGVFHLAAESHVDNSIKGPEPFILSNVVGTFNILEECRQLWDSDPEEFKDSRFLHVSTDEVFGTLGDEGKFTEETPYAPNSPYSASKASSDMLVRAYYHTYGMQVVTTNCSNNFGPHQHDEKLIPTIIRNALSNKTIPIYGNGKNVRDWLYVGDHCNAIDLAYHTGKIGETYAVGGDNEWTNIELARKICAVLDQQVGKGPDGSYANLIDFVQDRLGHDFRYAIDSSKIQHDLGWKPNQTFDEALSQTVSYYVEKFS